MAAITINGNQQIYSSASQAFAEPEEHAELERLEVILQQYTGANTYICYYRPDDLDRIRRLDFVEYANVYHPDLVIQDVLKSKSDIQPPSAQYSSPKDPSTQTPIDGGSDEVFSVFVRLHENPERNASQLKQAMVNDLHLDPSKITVEEDHLTISGVAASDLQKIAPLDEVQSIGELVYSKTHNHVARQDLDFVDYTALDPSITRPDYDAEKIVVAVGDTGFDLGTTANQHAAFQTRVQKILNENNDHPSSADEWGHGTHVCGSVAANHASSQFGLIRGTAPGAIITMQAMAFITPNPVTGDDRSGSLKNPVGATFWQNAFDTGARIHSNSYGQGLAIDPADKDKRLQRPYSELPGTAGDVDKFMRANEEFLIIFAAGNDGRDAGITDTGATIGSASAAKNCLTVGACESSKKMSRAYIYDEKGSDMGDRNNIADFSSIGPTKNTLGPPNANSRFKPDVVAPGTIIYSAKSRFVPLKWHYDQKTHTSMSTDTDGKSTDPLFAFMSGTSMATPLVSGCAAVLRKMLLKSATPGSSVPAALIKALIINGAVDLDDFHQGRGPSLKKVPDNAQGFGRVSIAASLRNITDHVNCGYQPIAHPVVPLTQGKSTSYPIKILKAPKDGLQIVLKATMCYNDVGGNTDLVNVLNLKAMQGTDFKYGNTQNKTPDGLNNVQKVIWKDIHPGDATLVVECAAIKMPGMAPNQDYALAWSIEYVNAGVSAGQIALYSALGLAAAAIVAVIAVEAGHHH